ncbi:MULTISPECIES: hypothetical protein [unclassified Ochrobactrum]|uniref:hypothetical protein n=1 Tax=unclassified Ochrobactrum TaxID=239106 RepID=UPI0030965F1F
MNPVWKKWIISLVFGVIIARAGSTLFVPAILSQFGGAGSDSGNVDAIIIASLLVQLIIIAAVTFFLLRLADTRLRLGWGCLILGLVVLGGLIATVVSSDINIFELMKSNASGRNDEMTAFIFWLMVLVLPFAIGGLVLTVMGWFLISRNGQKKII